MSDLEHLLAVQDLDTALDQARYRRSHLPAAARLAEVRTALAEVARGEGELAGPMGSLAAEQQALEAEVAAGEAKAAQLERRMATSTVSKEAQALATELTGVNARTSDVETRLLEVMEAMEPLDARRAELGERRSSLERDEIVAIAELEAAQAEVDAEIASLVGRRASAVAAVPASMLERYEKLRPRLGGVAVARLDGAVCSGCHLSLPAVELDRVRHAAPDELVECSECGRLLVH